MGHALRIPRLPRGPRLDFVVELHDHYRAAKRPTLRTISETIRADALKGTASRETIRRMLLGEVVPAQWETVNAVFLTLCKIAGRDPASGDEYDNNDPRSYAEVLEWRWNEALDAWGPPPASPDPWGTGSDEAPF